MVCLNQVLLVIAAAGLCLAQPTITFEQNADGQVLTTQIAGVTFANAVAIQAGYTLNELSFPVRSGTVAAGDRGGPLSVTFSRPASVFSAYITHTRQVTVSAYDGSGVLLRSVVSPSVRNFVASGEEDAFANELIELRVDRIARVVLSGDPGGSSLVVDDITYKDFVERPTLSVTPDRVTFDYALTLPAPQPERITIDAEPGATYTSESSARWVRVAPASGPADGRIFLVLDTTQLPLPGNYAATVTFRSGEAARTVAVNLRLAGAPILYGLPSSLTFTQTKGGPKAGTQAILVGSRNANQVFSVAPSASWLVTGQTGGSTPANVFVDVAPGDLAVGTYTGEVRLIPNNSQERVVIPVKLEIRAATAVMEVRDVVNAGSRMAGPVAPGSMVEIRGANLSRTVERSGLAGTLPRSLAAISVLLAGAALPLQFAGPDRVVAQLPMDLQPGEYTLRLRSGSLDFADFPFSVAVTAPGIVLQEERSSALHEDGTANSQKNPAKAGSSVSVYLTGQGALTPGARPVLPVTVRLGDSVALVREAVMAPGQTGILRVTLTVPELPQGDHLVRVKVGESESNPAVVSVGAR